MRKLTADYILHPDGKLKDNHILMVGDSGEIIDLVPSDGTEAEYHGGILCPGFVNTHCHLELSHLKNKIPPGTGLDGFIKSFLKARGESTSGIREAISVADAKMWESGIQAVGDICNTSDTFEIKQKSPIRYHSFVELFNFQPDDAAATMDTGNEKYLSAVQSHNFASLVPHAPYSVPPLLFQLIAAHHLINNDPWCIHNQETAAENEMFKNGSGALWDTFKEMGIDMSWFHPSGKNSLSSISIYFPPDTNLLFIHNTFTSIEDIEFLKSGRFFERTWFGICAKANLYIEKRLPDIRMLHQAGCRLTIGTDSLASNDSLSILDELKTISGRFPEITVEQLLSWSTKNGAEYFKWNDLGSFRKHARPGVLLLAKATQQFISDDCIATRLI